MVVDLTLAAMGADVDAARVLLQSGAKVDIRDASGQTALMVWEWDKLCLIVSSCSLLSQPTIGDPDPK